MRLRTVQFIIMITLGSMATCASEQVSSPTRTATVSSENWNDSPTPTFCAGYLFHHGSEDGSITVYSFVSGEPKLELRTSIRPEGASTVTITDTAASASGLFAASGMAFNSAGQGSSFIAFFGSGKPQLIVQLPNMGAFRVVFVPDGTLWVLVHEVDSTLNELSEYNLLRHYSPEGKFLGSILPRSQFPTDRRSLGVGPSLSSSKDTIGLYFDWAGVWVELASDGSVKGRWQLPKTQLDPRQRVWFERLDLTNSNDVIRTSYVSGKERSDHFTRLEHLHKSGSSLVPSLVDLSTLPMRQPWLSGVDGGQLIWVNNRGGLFWSTLQ